jgi:sulfur-oxidizing protein SoxX
MRRLILAAVLLVLSPPVPARQNFRFDHALVNKYIASSWTSATPEWAKRLDQDETQRICSETANAPAPAAAAAIQARERAIIRYPADGKLLGDWRRGEAVAQNGYGGRFTDTDSSRPKGGNCYACHQLDPKEVSFGTLGPSLREYGKNHNYNAADTKAVYDKIYNAQAAWACSNMPRFGSSGSLAIEQIKDLVALLMDPDSPVNK